MTRQLENQNTFFEPRMDAESRRCARIYKPICGKLTSYCFLRQDWIYILGIEDKNKNPAETIDFAGQPSLRDQIF